MVANRNRCRSSRMLPATNGMNAGEIENGVGLEMASVIDWETASAIDVRMGTSSEVGRAVHAQVRPLHY